MTRLDAAAEHELLAEDGCLQRLALGPERALSPSQSSPYPASRAGRFDTRP